MSCWIASRRPWIDVTTRELEKLMQRLMQNASKCQWHTSLHLAAMQGGILDGSDQQTSVTAPPSMAPHQQKQHHGT